MQVEDILPPPFAWCAIPAGDVALELGRLGEGMQIRLPVAGFAMAKYPVTNDQFAAFIGAGGYDTRRWWTDVGWQMCIDGGWDEPHFWQDAKWNGGLYPVVGVSWYEAEAFCGWLSEASGERIGLPTETQWQRAAQGDDGRLYAWGSRFHEGKANTDASWLGGTTPVTQYPKGASPYGVMDMNGNVWEWCERIQVVGGQIVPTGNLPRAVRGGAWNYSKKSSRVAYRTFCAPELRVNWNGFRCVKG